MNPNLLVSLLITTVVAIIGWMVAHRLTAKRDLVNKRRELRVEYLIEAYRRLERAGNRRDLSKYSAELESALADIQLFGTPEQVEKAQGFAVDFAKTMPLHLMNCSLICERHCALSSG